MIKDDDIKPKILPSPQYYFFFFIIYNFLTT